MAYVRGELSNSSLAECRVALINPPDLVEADVNRTTAPLGLGYIAAAARASGAAADIFDLSDYRAHSLVPIDSIGLIDDYSIYGITTYSDNFMDSIGLVRALRQLAPGATIVMGGYHATAADVAILRDFPEVDVVFRRDSEESFSEFVTAHKDQTQWNSIAGITFRDVHGDLHRTGERQRAAGDIDKLSMPVIAARHAPSTYYVFPDYKTGVMRRALPMVSSRGCPKRCTFCSIIRVNPVWRARSVESLMHEIVVRRAQMPFEHVLFQDANFFVDVRRSVAFARALHDFDPSITWSGTATADLLVRHALVMEELVALNCSFVEIGIESGNAGSLRRFNKGTTVAMNEQVLAMCERLGLHVGVDFIMFEPEMSFDEFRANVAFLSRNEIFGEWPAHYAVQELRLYPGTPYRDSRAIEAPDIHVVPRTEYDDPVVAEVARSATQFLSETQSEAIDLLKRMTEYVGQSLFAAERGSDADAVLIQNVQVACIRLKHLAARFVQAASERSADRRRRRLAQERQRARDVLADARRLWLSIAGSSDE